MPESSIILSLETATRRGSVCLTRANELLASAVGEDLTSHSNTLLKQIDQVLVSSRFSLEDVSLFAAASGPGSFTGLRIGLATVKGLAATLDRPCAGIPTLQAVARAGGVSAVTVALLPAGRGELFAQKLAVMPDGTVVELDQPSHISPAELLNKYGNEPSIRWCGEGAQARSLYLQEFAQEQGICFTELQKAEQGLKQDGWTLAPAEPLLARHVAALAQVRLEQGETGDPNSLRAFYVRPSDAELKSHGYNAADS